MIWYLVVEYNTTIRPPPPKMDPPFLWRIRIGNVLRIPEVPYVGGLRQLGGPPGGVNFFWGAWLSYCTQQPTNEFRCPCGHREARQGFSAIRIDTLVVEYNTTIRPPPPKNIVFWTFNAILGGGSFFRFIKNVGLRKIFEKKDFFYG